MVTLAVDIGGTKLAVGLVDDTGRVLHRSVVPTAGRGDPDALFADIERLVGEARSQSPVERCGVGCGGPMTGHGETVSPVNIPAWNRFPLQRRMRDLVGVPVQIDNDAKAFALAEGWLGAARGVQDYVGMVVSTGIGAGVVSRGRLLEGASGNAGHIGHVHVSEGTEPWDRHPAGLLESEASGTAIAVRTGEPAAHADEAVRVRTGMLVGRAVASVANLLDLRLAVVGGSVALGYGEVFFAAAQAEIDRLCVLDYSAGTRIVPAGLGGDSPLIGAAALALRADGLDFGIS